MIKVCLGLTLFLLGCVPWGFDKSDAIVARSVTSWSNRDCMTIVLSAMQHNYYDPEKPPIIACATPYTPRVVMALNRMSQIKHQWSDKTFQHHADALLKDASGLYADWEHNEQIYDSKLNRLRNLLQMDSMMFLVTLSNRTWPCAPPVLLTLDNVAGEKTPQFMQLSDWPCEVPDISNIESNISLINDHGDTVRPKYVWGRKDDQLMSDETLLIMFPLRSDKTHILDKSAQITLQFTEFKPKLQLTFSIVSLR